MVTLNDVNVAIKSLVNGQQGDMRLLLRKIPMIDFADAVFQEIEDERKTNDYEFLMRFDSVLRRVLEAQDERRLEYDRIGRAFGYMER